MLRFLAGAAACFLLMTGAFLIWQSRAEHAPSLPRAPAARLYQGDEAQPVAEETLSAPEASPKSREQKRFSRADKNKDGKIQEEELLIARRKAFAKLDGNSNGALSFDEWAVKTITKFKGADKDRDGMLTAAEFATTAPPPPKHKSCACRAAVPAAATAAADD